MPLGSPWGPPWTQLCLMAKLGSTTRLLANLFHPHLGIKQRWSVGRLGPWWQAEQRGGRGLRGHEVLSDAHCACRPCTCAREETGQGVVNGGNSG